MYAVFEQVLILLIFCAVGFVLCRTRRAKTSHVNILSVLEIYVFLPCLTFNNFAKNFNLEYIRQRYIFIIISICLLVISYPVATLLAKPLTKKPYHRGLYHYIFMIPNYGYIGYALCQSLYGDKVLLDMMIFALAMNAYAHSIGYSMLTSPEDGKVNFKRIISPPVIGSLLGCVVGLSGIALPQVITEVSSRAASCTAPISMLLTGMVIAEFSVKDLLKHKASYIVSAIRLILLPLMALALLKLASAGFVLLNLSALSAVITAAIPVAVLTYAMPCGMNTIVYPGLIGEDCHIGASTVLISTIASLLTIPLCVYFLL